MWNKTAQPYVDDGKLVVLGVIQEQHPERCKLYAQWKNFEWPIVYDQMNSLGIAVVPVPLLIDEHGVVRNARPSPRDLASFMKEKFEKPTDTERPATVVARPLTHEAATSDAVESIDTVIASRKKLIAANPEDAVAMFQLGVAYRAKFDAPGGKPKDFEQASQLWTAARQINPNQYIWRRRIEQYGPRLEKPYPFYDWVPTAIAEIEKRGEKPVELKVALSGSEIAKRSGKFVKDESAAKNPDPNNKITRDTALIQLRPTVVPSKIAPFKTNRRGQKIPGVARVHLVMTPEDAKWNNESEGVSVWIDKQTGGTTSKQMISLDNPKSPESNEMRNIEFEFQVGEGATECQVSGFVLYNVCEDESGQCVYRRQDFTVDIPLKTKSK